MAFELQLQDSLRYRESRIALEFAAGDGLETVLSRHLLAIEAFADTDLLTSILLLDQDGKRLSHGAAPSLPKDYCEAIDGVEIGPDVGSCGTAAYLGHAIYVTDIAADPLWKDFRDLALPHGLRACWSTPICDDDGVMLGTFAIYHLTPRSPTPDEVEAIRLITDHVAQAIIWSRSRQGERQRAVDIGRPNSKKHSLKLVSTYDRAGASTADNHQDVIGFSNRLQAHATRLDRFADMVESPELTEALKAAAADCRKLVEVVRREHDRPSNGQWPST